MKYMHIVFSLIIWLVIHTLPKRRWENTTPRDKNPSFFSVSLAMCHGFGKVLRSLWPSPIHRKGKESIVDKRTGDEEERTERQADGTVGSWMLPGCEVCSTPLVASPVIFLSPPTLHLVDSTWNKLKVFISFLELKMKFTSYLGIEAKTWVQSTIDDSQYFSLGELSSSGCLQNNINK